jgi:hypothetical protein
MLFYLLFLEGSKGRAKISTLIIGSPITRDDLVNDFEVAMIPRSSMIEGKLHVDPGHDLCLKVEARLFYCNKVCIYVFIYLSHYWFLLLFFFSCSYFFAAEANTLMPLFAIILQRLVRLRIVEEFL